MSKELMYVDVVEESAIVSLDTIIEFSGNKEKSVRELVWNNKEELVELGLSYIKDIGILNGDLLNEPEITYNKLAFNQESATYLLSLMKNTPQIKRFKFTLVKDFFKAREILMSSQTIFDKSQLEHIKQFMPDQSQYGKLVESTGLAKVKPVRGYFRTDKHNKLSRLVGERVRLENRLGGLFDEEIQIQIDALNKVIVEIGSQIQIEHKAAKVLVKE